MYNWLPSFNNTHVVVRFYLHHRSSDLQDLGCMLTMKACVAEHLVPEGDTCVQTGSCSWPNCCGSDFWDALPYAVNSMCNILYQCHTEEACAEIHHTEEDWIACARSFRQTTCWRRLGTVLQKLPPLAACWGRLDFLCRKLLRWLTEEGRVSCAGSHPHIIPRKTEETCIVSFSGSLRGKTGLLTPEASYCGMLTECHIYTLLYFWCRLLTWKRLFDYPSCWALNS
jgi:hypothetical protein